jgi:hypothetical protein
VIGKTYEKEIYRPLHPKEERPIMRTVTLTQNAVSTPMPPLFAEQQAAQARDRKAPKHRYDNVVASGRTFCIQEGAVVFLGRC